MTDEMEFKGTFTATELLTKHQCDMFTSDETTKRVANDILVLLLDEQLRELDEKLTPIDTYLGVAQKAAPFIYGYDKFHRVNFENVPFEQKAVLLAEGIDEAYEILRMCRGSSIERENLYNALIMYNIRGKQIVIALEFAGNKTEMISKIESGDQTLLDDLNKEMEGFANKSKREQPRAVTGKQSKYWFKPAVRKANAF